jgi:NAD(P)-dependent dehydrogenase (short-subunit alcohol dehydrogenase family)
MYQISPCAPFGKNVNTFSEFVRVGAGAWCTGVIQAALTGGTALRSWPLSYKGIAEPRLSAVVSGRSVLVTGASSGIGRAVAQKLADAGAKVILVARSEERLDALAQEITARGRWARAYGVDLSSPVSTEAFLARMANDGVVVDILINSAGRSIRRPVGESCARVHDYERTMAINYFGSIRLILRLLPKMRARGSGHVINVSTAGVQVGTPWFSAYIASKAALDAFTRIAGTEAREDGVLFSTVHMPLVRTPMIEPTEAFRDVRALSPEQAADLVLRPLVTREKELGTRLGRILHLVHVIAPDLSEQVASKGHRLLGFRG